MPAKGYSWSDAPRLAAPDPAPGLPRWEALAIDAVGNVIEFWGFKHNQGRVWAVLYLRGTSMTATQLEEELGLSKGAVSMLVRDLERWGVVVRIRQPGTGAWHFRAETDLVQMVRRVIQERETAFITRIRADLEEARRLAAASGVGRERLARLEKLAALAVGAERALRIFLRTARVDLSTLLVALGEGKLRSRT
ncbi:MAG: MarR family transcriptional regulator [Myxococcaceae bacterium]|nr:MAG: MarR family transcriptional regulator [Myxococcaceae bacterium]